MTLVPTVLSVAAGFCIFAGILHLIIGLSRRPRDWLHITFALSSLAIAGNSLSVIAIHTADSVDAYVAAFKYGFGPTILVVMIGLIWFVALYTGVRPRNFLLVMSLWFTGIIILMLVLPNGILFAEVLSIRPITMPWGEQFVLAQTTPHPLRLINDLFMLTYFGFLLFATYRQFRRGDRRRARVLALAVILFFSSVIFDTLVDTGLLDSIYTNEIAFLGFVIAMSIQLNSEIIETEAELDLHRVKLESLVEERTAELEATHAQLLAHAQETAVAEDRSRLARDLHDVITQILFSINLIAMGLPRLWKRDPAMAERSTNELQRLTSGALADMRIMLRELRPHSITATNLDTLLIQLCDGLAARHDIPLDVSVDLTCEVPPKVHVALYRIAQETMNNIAKHANASQVSVDVTCDDRTVYLSIRDDGYGFDMDRVPAERMGLEIMRERAAGIGADLTIRSQPEAGTTVAVAWPINQSGEDADE
jgi:signal transduction histidine kinase